MKQSDLKVSFYLKKNDISKEGTCPIIGRINIGRYSESAFSVKLSASPTAWMNGRATGKSVATQKINRHLDEIRATAYSVYQELSAIRMKVTADEIKCRIQGMAFGQETIMEYFRTFIENYTKRAGVIRSHGTLKTYRSTYGCLDSFLASEYRLSDIPFTALDRSFIDKYDIYLRTQRRHVVSTVAFYTARLKLIVAEAIADGIITADPFAGYEAEKPRCRQNYLTSDELQKLMTTPLHNRKLYHVRDMFLFSCYTGIPYGDMCLLTEDNLEIAEDGIVWIKSSRKKTKIDYEILLLDIPLKIIAKYKGTASDRKLFPMYCNQTMSAHLKEIAKICGIERKLVYHHARHTYATEITLAHGVPIETVSRMLGHSQIKTTQIYAKVTDDKISNDTMNLDREIESRFTVTI